MSRFPDNRVILAHLRDSRRSRESFNGRDILVHFSKAFLTGTAMCGTMLLISLFCGHARAEVDVTQLQFSSSVDFGGGSVDEDIFLLVLLEQGLSWNGLEVRLSGPLRFRVLDQSPADEGVLRRQDWDESSDYMRILRTATFEHYWKDGNLKVHLGELAGVGLGHGSLVDHYYNLIHMDNYQGGAKLGLDWRGNGIGLLLENVIRPELLVGRAYVSPLWWFWDTKWARRLEIGAFLGADINAPYRLGEQGHTVFVTAGGDVSFRVVDEKWLVIMPYTDFIGMDGDWGVHVGMAGDWWISERPELRLSVRGEYRYVGPDYHPAIFNPFYDHNRLDYPAQQSGQRITLADHLADIEDLPSRHGFMVDAIFEWGRGLRFGFRYDTEGRDRRHWLLFRVEVFPWEGYSIAAFYGGQDVRGGGSIFSLDSLIGVSARGRVWGPFNLFVDWTRRWRHEVDPIGDQLDYLEMANEIIGGIGMLFIY